MIVASARNDYIVNKEVKYYPVAFDTVLSSESLDSKGEIFRYSQREDWVYLYVSEEDITIKS